MYKCLSFCSGRFDEIKAINLQMKDEMMKLNSDFYEISVFRLDIDNFFDRKIK